MSQRIPFAVGFVLFVVYLTTMNPTVSFIDSGELAAVAATLGIAHPTGYPLFTILGRLVVSAPGSAEPILALNVFGAFMTSLAAVLFFQLMLVLFRSEVFGVSRKKMSGDGVVFGAGTLILGFSTTFWAQSVAIEVYSLHLVLLMLILLTFVKGLEETSQSDTVISRHLVLCTFLVGLSFTNHMTTLLVLPACAFLYFRILEWRKESLKTLAKLSPFFLLGLSLYLYLPVRAWSIPALNWGDPSSLQRLFWHVSGKQYRNWIFSGFESAEKQLGYFLSNFPSEFHWISLVLLLLGTYTLFRERRPLFWFALLLVAGCLAYSINYDIHDIDSYFLLAYVSTAVIIVFGLHKVIVVLSASLHRWVLVCVVAIPPVVQYGLHRSAVDESDNFLVHDYTKTILQTVDTNAVILTYQWDYFVSASYYFQFVRGDRPDVAVIDKELLRRSWYFSQLERNHPWLTERCRRQIDAFLKELHKFEHGLPYEGRIIDARFNEMINEMISQAMKDRPVYVGPEIEPQFALGFERHPVGLLFRVGDPGKPVVPDLHYRATAFESRLTKGIRFQYARMLTVHGIWLKNGGFVKKAESAFRQALEIDPTFEPAKALLRE